jgi:conjugal transfer pilin signal peptidase TrbI
MKIEISKTGKVCGGLMLAAIAAQVIAMPWYRLFENPTHSISGTIFVWEKNVIPKKGELAVLKWKGGSGYAPDTLMFKSIIGVPGDVITVENTRVFINGALVAEALPSAPSGKPTPTIPAQTIPLNHFFLKNPAPDSFDSRYEAFGLVATSAIVGKAHKVF